MGYISLPTILNAIIGIAGHCCVIVKIVILHDAIKKIQNVLFSLALSVLGYDIFVLRNRPTTSGCQLP